MTTATILNAILAVGVIVMVVAPLVWAILTQNRDYQRPAATGAAAERPATSRERRPARRPHSRPVTG
jgi:hypothetical protein